VSIDLQKAILSLLGQTGAKCSRLLCGPDVSFVPSHPTEDVNEIKALGGNGTTTPSARTVDQTEIARFCYEDAPLQWNRIARSLATDRKLDPWQSAQLLAWLNVAQADGYIGSSNAKYHYRFWWPETAIHLADTDGNAEKRQIQPGRLCCPHRRFPITIQRTRRRGSRG